MSEDKVKDLAATDAPFLMLIQDVFSIRGRGTVVAGKIERGKIRVGEEVEIVGPHETRKTVIAGIEMIKMMKVQVPSNNVGLLLKDVGQNEVERGMVVAKPGSVARDGSGVLVW